jgi:mRNA interferase RelE/StbE
VGVRVELIDEAVEDLSSYAESGNIRLFLAKLVQLERDGASAGVPLGSTDRTSLTGWRKIVVGNRDRRIVFRVDEKQEVATVCVIGDRSNEAVYTEAQQRMERLPDQGTKSLADAMLMMMGSRKERKKAAKERRR